MVSEFEGRGMSERTRRLPAVIRTEHSLHGSEVFASASFLSSPRSSVSLIAAS